MQVLTAIVNNVVVINFEVIGTLPNINTVQLSPVDGGYICKISEYMLFSGGIIHHLCEIGVLRAIHIF